MCSAMKLDHEIDENDLFGENSNSQRDIEMKEDKKELEQLAKSPTQTSKMDVDEEAALSLVTFEEVLLLRLAFELNRNTAHQRSQ